MAIYNGYWDLYIDYPIRFQRGSYCVIIQPNRSGCALDWVNHCQIGYAVKLALFEDSRNSVKGE